MVNQWDSLPVEKKGGSLFWTLAKPLVQVSISHHEPDSTDPHHVSVKGLIDTGACYSVMSQELCDALGLANIGSIRVFNATNKDSELVPAFRARMTLSPIRPKNNAASGGAKAAPAAVSTIILGTNQDAAKPVLIGRRTLLDMEAYLAINFKSIADNWWIGNKRPKHMN